MSAEDVGEFVEENGFPESSDGLSFAGKGMRVIREKDQNRVSF